MNRSEERSIPVRSKALFDTRAPSKNGGEPSRVPRPGSGCWDQIKGSDATAKKVLEVLGSSGSMVMRSPLTVGCRSSLKNCCMLVFSSVTLGRDPTTELNERDAQCCAKPRRVFGGCFPPPPVNARRSAPDSFSDIEPNSINAWAPWSVMPTGQMLHQQRNGQ